MTDTFSLETTADKPLSALSILVTRPAKQAKSLIVQLELLGATVLHQPSIEILPVISAQQDLIINAIEQYDGVVFISKNAVEYGLELFSNANKNIDSSFIAAIGKATSDALSQRGYRDVIRPEDGFDSEALLNTVAFSSTNINNQQILIIRGGEGREHLKEVLESRGAIVTYFDVYSRDVAPLILQPNDFISLDIITVSSQQGLENLVSMLDNQTLKQLYNKRLICPSERCANRARELAFNHVETASNATDNAMLNCIIDKKTNSQNG